jgi:hypothetical protein
MSRFPILLLLVVVSLLSTADYDKKRVVSDNEKPPTRVDGRQAHAGDGVRYGITMMVGVVTTAPV